MNRRIRNFFILSASVFAVFLLSTCLNLNGGDGGSNEVPTPGPVHMAASVSFTDIDLGSGEIAGSLTITKAVDESDVTHYALYWGGSATTKLAGAGSLIAVFPKGSSLTRNFPPDTAVPSGATHLVVLTKNAEGEMSSGVGCAADVKGTSYAGTEGTAASPVFLAAGMGGKKYNKTIGKGKSYFYTTALGTFLNISLGSLTDDADIVYYGTDSSFTTPDSESLEQNYGRIQDEYIGVNSVNGTNYYFTVDGVDTGYKLNAPGASYSLVVMSHSGAVSNVVSEGSQSEPVLLQTGVEDGFQVAASEESFYKFPVTAGESYIVNAASGPIITLYTDQFTTMASSPATATGDFIYVKVTSSGSQAMGSIELVGREGSAVAPVYLKTVKTNFCMVNNASSYFSFDVTQGQSYTVTASDFSTGSFSTHDVDLFVFPSGSFSGTPTSSATSNDPESVIVTAQAAVLLVRVDDKSGYGGIFQLKVQ